MAIPPILIPSCAALPITSCQSPKTKAIAILPEAGIVVTEMKTPTSPLVREEVNDKTPAAPATTAMTTSSGCR